MKTPISATERARRRNDGFTTVELLAALVLISLAASVAGYAGSRSMETARFRAFLIKAASLAAEGRTASMRSATEIVFIVDARRRLLGYVGGEGIAVPDGVAFTAVAAQSETQTDGTVGIRFYPSGGSSGGAMMFSYRERTYEIRINWLTGNVTIPPV